MYAKKTMETKKRFKVYITILLIILLIKVKAWFIAICGWQGGQL